MTLHPDKIRARCSGCGGESVMERQAHDHPKAAVVEFNGCPDCGANEGGFEEVTYYDEGGAELMDDPATYDGSTNAPMQPSEEKP